MGLAKRFRKSSTPVVVWDYQSIIEIPPNFNKIIKIFFLVNKSQIITEGAGCFFFIIHEKLLNPLIKTKAFLLENKENPLLSNNSKFPSQFQKGNWGNSIR